MKKLISIQVLFTVLTVASVLSGCSSAPTKGDLEWQDKQAMTCRKACFNSDVGFAEIDGLNCFCNKPQSTNSSPVIINNIPGQSAPQVIYTPQPQSSYREPSVDRRVYERNASTKELEPADNAATFSRADGKQVYSQVQQ